MKYPIFLAMVVIGLFSVSHAKAQGTYGSSSGYNYGYAQQPAQYYSGYAPAYYYGGGSPYTSGYSTPQPPPQYRGYNNNISNLPSQVDISNLGDWQKNPEYFEFIRARTKKEYGKNPPVEFWLEKRVGRVGDYWFEALGGKKTHKTPKGTFTVKSKYKDFYSRKYEAEMPLSVFFTEQCAVHVGSLRVLSHGCIHVAKSPAKRIFDYADAGKTKVKVHP